MNYDQPMLKENALEERTIVITGGGTGLGRSMATYFSTLKANVVITSRRSDVLAKAAAEITKQTGNPVYPVTCDIRNYDQVEPMLESSIREFGKVNVLVNNAAGNFISPTEKLSHRAFDSVVDIVLKGSYNCTLAFGKYWIKEQIPANVLNIVTTYAWTGSSYVVPSACAKAGVLALTRSLATEWAKYKIRLNAIAPGPFPTKGAWDRLFPEPVQKMVDPINEIPLGRTGHHQELANLAAYMVSEYAAYFTGEVITIDGGEWLKDAGMFNHFSQIPEEIWDLLAKSKGKANPKS